MKAGGNGHSAPIGLGFTGGHRASEGRMGSSGPNLSLAVFSSSLKS